MSQDYLLRLPTTRLSRQLAFDRALPLFTRLGARFEGNVTRLEREDRERSHRFAIDQLSNIELHQAIRASADWTGVALEFGTKFGYIKLLLWDGEESQSGTALWETSSVFGSQAEDPDAYDLFESFSVSMAEALELKWFALTRDPIIATIPFDSICEAISKPPRSPGRAAVVVAGIQTGNLTSLIGIQAEPTWCRSMNGTFMVFREPQFGVFQAEE